MLSENRVKWSVAGLALTAAVAGMWWFALSNVKAFEQTCIAQEQRHLLVLARQEAQHVEHGLEEIQENLSRLARHPAVQQAVREGLSAPALLDRDGYSPEVIAFQEELADDVSAMYRLDAKGIVQSRLPSAPQFIGQDCSDKPGVRVILAHQGELGRGDDARHDVCISDVFTARSGEPAISVCVPMFDKDELIGILRALLYLKDINEWLGHTEVGKKGYPWVVDEHGTMLCHPKPKHRGMDVMAIRRKTFPDSDWFELEGVVRRMTSGESGAATYHSAWWSENELRIVRKLVGFAPVRAGDRQWSVGVSMSYDDIAGPIKAHSMTILSGALLLMLGLLGVGLWLFRLEKKKVRLEAQAQSASSLAQANRWLESEVAERTRAEETLEARVAELADAREAALNMMQDAEQAGEALAERARHAALGADVGVALTKGETLEETLQACAEAIAEHLDAAFARIWTLNAQENVLELQASAGMYTHIDGAHSRVPVGALKIGLIAHERQAHLTNAVQDDPRIGDKAWARREGMVAFTGHPLVVKDRLVGVMAMFARRPLRESTVRSLGSVADEIALGIDRHRAEAALRESEERHRAITECAQDAIITCDAEGTIRLWNPAAEKIFGHTATEAVGNKMMDLIVPPQYREVMRKGLTEFARTGRGNAIGKTLELTALRKDGTEFPVELSLTAYKDRECFLGVALVRDITERKKMEERLRHSQKMEAVGSLVAGVAHDYNNQLQAVLASLEMALEDLAPDSPTYVAVHVAERAARRSLEITKGLLSYSRGESEGHVRIDLGELLCEAGQVHQRVLPANIRFKLSHDESLWPIMGNATQIQQVLMNLMVNARDAMPAGGTLTIAAANRTIDANRDSPRPKQVVLISVSDTGIGMDSETVSRIFDPFFTTKERGQGTGLGLSLVHGIVENHGGWIEVRSALGSGTTFDIFLPAIESAACERPPQESTVCATSSPLSGSLNSQETRRSEE